MYATFVVKVDCTKEYSTPLILLPLLVAVQVAQVNKHTVTYVSPIALHQQSTWSVSPGANTVVVSADEVYVAQKEASNTRQFAIAQTRVDTGKKGNWRVSFEVRMGVLGTTPTGVGLYAGRQIIGWVGADGYYKVLGTFIGKGYFDTIDRSLFPRADGEWHTIVFSGTSGGIVTIQRDGRTVARTYSCLRPDTVKVGQAHLLFDEAPASLQQAELTMRRLWIEHGDAL